MKSRTSAAVLAFFFGNIGAHKFYLGQGGVGFLYLCFCWTFIPALVGFVEGIQLFSMSDQQFNAQYNAWLLPSAAPAPQNLVVNVNTSAVSGGQSGGDIAAQVKSLHELHQGGALTAEEFVEQKRKLLSR
jgi:TM2 domain-containing membrane protein YozV